MTQEDKELLLKDLSARLTYNPFIKIGENPHAFKLSQRVRWIYSYGGVENMFDNTKPYLRPMSSMTDKEQRYIWDKYGPSFLVADFEDVGDVSELFNLCQMNISEAPSFADWLNAHHFDYRGLIEKGLALEAKEGMYKAE